MALYMSYEPIKKLGMIHSLFKQGDAALDRIDFISKQPDTVPDPVGPLPFHAPKRRSCLITCPSPTAKSRCLEMYP